MERRRRTSGKNYASGLLKKLEKRGYLMRTGHGRYRITRYNPHLVARRHGLFDTGGKQPDPGPRARKL